MIKIQGLSYQYKAKNSLFEELSLELPPGNIYGLLGKNGAGKSTLLKLIGGLLFPKRGEIKVIDFVPYERQPAFLQEVFVLHEEFHVPSFTIKKYINLYSPFYPRFDKEAFDNYLREFNLDYDEKLTSLSYGQKKKFLLSFGLATDCKLLILDEPTNGLDIPSKSQFRKVVANAIHEDRTFVISTHQARDMENLIDPIIILDEGEVVFNESYETINSRLSVSRKSELPTDDSIVYSEAHFGSYTIIQEKTDDQESNINLELLFNAVVNSKDKIHQLFQKEHA